MILDSGFLIDLLAGDPGAVAKLDELSDRLLAVPTIAYTEVAMGFDPSSPEAHQFESVMEEATLVA